MGVKNNFSQAVSELMGISRTVEPEGEKVAAEKKQVVAEEPAGKAEMTAETTAQTTAQTIAQKTEPKEEKINKGSTVIQVSNPKERIMAMLAQQQSQVQNTPTSQTLQSQPSAAQIQAQGVQAQGIQTQSIKTESQPPQQSTEPTEPAGVTTIAKGTVIIGEINADGDVELLGSIRGRVSSKGDIKVNGKVIGDLAGRDIELTACAVQGNIFASGMVTVDGDSVVIGDVKGENFCLDGKIKGNVTVEKEAKFQPKAILAGNVTTASIAMSQGAKIQGEVNIPLSEKETNMSFDVEINI